MNVTPEHWLLTPREFAVLRLLALGQSNAEIANGLGISHRTVRAHVEHLLRKTQARDRLALALIALKHRVIDLDELPCDCCSARPAVREMGWPGAEVHDMPW